MKSVFASFWSGGFESASHINRHGQRLDLIATTQHDQFAVDDYRLLSTMGLHTARDAVRWPLVDRSGEYQFESFVPMLKASLAAGIQVNWTLCHYGWPDDIDILSPRFVDRFARYAAAVRCNHDNIECRGLAFAKRASGEQRLDADHRRRRRDR